MKVSRVFYRATVLIALLGVGSVIGCGPENPGTDATGSGANTSTASKPQKDKTVADRLRVSTERDVIISVSEAIRKRDLKALQATAAPELAAELRRLHDKDIEQFWKRGQVWVHDVGSGFELTHREDDSKLRWHVLVEFDNGRAERVTFTRVDGGLRLDEL